LGLKKEKKSVIAINFRNIVCNKLFDGKLWQIPECKNISDLCRFKYFKINTFRWFSSTEKRDKGGKQSQSANRKVKAKSSIYQQAVQNRTKSGCKQNSNRHHL